MKLTLIENWREAWKFMSVHAAIITGLIAASYDYLPALQQSLPPDWAKYAAIIIVLARVIDQKNVK